MFSRWTFGVLGPILGVNLHMATTTYPLNIKKEMLDRIPSMRMVCLYLAGYAAQTALSGPFESTAFDSKHNRVVYKLALCAILLSRLSSQPSFLGIRMNCHPFSAAIQFATFAFSVMSYTAPTVKVEIIHKLDFAANNTLKREISFSLKSLSPSFNQFWSEVFNRHKRIISQVGGVCKSASFLPT